MALSQNFIFTVLALTTFILLLLTFLTPGTPLIAFTLAIFTLFFDVLTFSTKYYASFFVPFLKMKNRNLVMESEEPFIMAPSGDAIVIRREGEVYASAFIRIPTYRSATEMSQEEKVDFSRLFSRALTLTKRPMKFGAQLYVINKDAYINNIRNKLNEAEDRYQNAMISKDISKEASERIRGEVTMWHNLYDSVSKVNSHALEAFAMTTSSGGNDEEAITLALQQADEIAAGISSIFGVTASIAQGEELLRFIEPDYMIPLVTVSEEMRGKATLEER